MIDDISLAVILFTGAKMLHIIEAFDMLGAKLTFYVLDEKDPVGAVRSCAEADGLRLRDMKEVKAVESWEGRVGMWVAPDTTKEEFDALLQSSRETLSYAEALEQLKRDLIEGRIKKVHECLDGPCTFHSVKGQVVKVMDNGRLKTLQFDPLEGGFELLL